MMRASAHPGHDDDGRSSDSGSLRRDSVSSISPNQPRFGAMEVSGCRSGTDTLAVWTIHHFREERLGWMEEAIAEVDGLDGADADEVANDWRALVWEDVSAM